MFRKILLPVDLSDKHDRAIEIAAQLTGQSGGEVVLVHVIEVTAGLGVKEEKAFYKRLESAAKKHLNQLGAQFKEKKVAWRSEILFGNRGAEIVRCGRDFGPDLIVLTAPQLT